MQLPSYILIPGQWQNASFMLSYFVWNILLCRYPHHIKSWMKFYCVDVPTKIYEKITDQIILELSNRPICSEIFLKVVFKILRNIWSILSRGTIWLIVNIYLSESSTKFQQNFNKKFQSHFTNCVGAYRLKRQKIGFAK